ncbi:hypothetical protein QL285_041453 [Trifolium repens]|nr:hypothetical protein QL285_041453 [Trifolium repens]
MYTTLSVISKATISKSTISDISEKTISDISEETIPVISKETISGVFGTISYIVDIIKVNADGNCGFRAIASLLGYTEDGWPIVRRELDNELRSNNSLYIKLFGERIHGVRDSLQISGLGDQSKDKWFTIPAMGYLVANRYNVILVTLDKPSKTFFHMMTSYFSSAMFFCIGYVGENHWVQVNMNLNLWHLIWSIFL